MRNHVYNNRSIREFVDNEFRIERHSSPNMTSAFLYRGDIMVGMADLLPSGKWLVSIDTETDPEPLAISAEDQDSALEALWNARHQAIKL